MNKKSALYLLFLCFLLAALIGCAAIKPAVETEEDRAAIKERDEAAEEERARKQLARLTRRHGDIDSASAELMESAAAFRSRGRMSLACEIYELISRGTKNDAAKSNALLKLAECRYHQKDLEESLSLTRLIISERYRDLCPRDELLKLMGDNLYAQRHFNPALGYYIMALSGSSNPRLISAVEKQIYAKLLPEYSEADILRLKKLMGDPRFDVLGDIFLARKSLDQGDEIKAAHFLTRALVKEKDVESIYWHDARKMLNQILKNRRASANRIGVLLPLSGKGSVFGDEVLKGILLGAGIFPSPFGVSEAAATDYRPLELVVRDTAGDPDKSVLALEELILKENVSAVIGPLFSQVSKEAAPIANQLRTPLLTFSQIDEVAESGEYVFKVGISQKDIISQLVDYSINGMGLTQFVVFYPQDSYGEELSRIFMDIAAKRGGKIMGMIPYDSNKTDYGAEIKQLAGIVREKSDIEIFEEQQEKIQKLMELTEDEEELSEKMESLKETERFALNFDAVFIPDYYRNLAQLAPQLAYYDVKEVTLLGSNGWNNPYLVEKAGRYVSGSFFCDEFFLNSKRAEMRSFVGSFRAAYQSDPSIVNAQGYEAMGFVRKSLAASDNSPAGIKNALLSGKKFDGVGGPVSITSQGIAWRTPFCLTVTSRGFREITLSEGK